MNGLLKKLTMLIALLTFNFTNILANDTVSVSLISEGDRGLALEKLLQFKCTDVWFPLLNAYAVDKEGNIYISVRYGDRLELPNGVVRSNVNMYVDAIMKFSRDYNLLWYKEINTNTKKIKNNSLNIACHQFFFDYEEKELYLREKAFKSDSIYADTLYYENTIIGIFDTTKTYNYDLLISVNTNDGELNNSVLLGEDDGNLKDVVYNHGTNDGIIYSGTIRNDFVGEAYSRGIDKWTFKKFSKDLKLVWTYSIGGDRIEYLQHAFGFNEPDQNMYIFGDTMYVVFPFQSDSIQINPDTNNPIYVYSSVYEMGFSGWGLQGQDAMIEKLCIANDTIKLLESLVSR